MIRSLDAQHQAVMAGASRCGAVADLGKPWGIAGMRGVALGGSFQTTTANKRPARHLGKQPT